MTNPKLSLGEKLLGVQHALISGAAGKPHSHVHVRVRNLVPEPPVDESFPAAFESEPSVQTDSRPSLTRLQKFDAEPVLKVWAASVRDMAESRGVKLEDLWALISCPGAHGSLQVTTRINDDMVAARFQQKLHGSIRVYVRLADFLTAVIEQDVPQFSVLGNEISFVAGGARNTIPYVEVLEDNTVKPAAPPEGGYTPVKWLGTGLSEAAKWCASGPDHFGRQAIRVIPKDDGSGNVEIVALCDIGGYRRLIKAPGIEHSLVVLPSWIIKHEKLLGKHLGIRVSGRDYMWSISKSGVVVGITMPELAWCTGYDKYFRGLDGRVEFTQDQVNALRRAIAQLEPLEYRDRSIGVTPNGSGLFLRGKNKTLEVEGMGDSGSEVLVNPDSLAEGLACRSVRFLEFDKEDPEQYVRLTGPDVSVAIQPLDQPVS